MDGSDILLLARAQFGLNVAFHILFPSLTIGLAWFLVYFRAQYARTGAAEWLDVYKVWTKVFALSFAMGVVSGITMSFQFGTNWPGFMLKVGNIAGPLLAYEVLTAFFLEASFLGVMLFGMSRVPPWLHMASTCIVAVGTTLSAFWILALNSWMQTPAGHVAAPDGALIAGSWLGVIWNPSFPYRMSHMLLASGLTASFVLAGLSAWRLLKAPGDGAATRSLRTALVVAAVLAPLQAFVGDLHGLNTLEHQPAKIAALEAIWTTEKGVPLTLVGIPNEKTNSTDYAIKLPKLGSLVLAHDADAEIQGLDRFPDHPPVAPVFFAFRAMVGVGMLMIAMAWFSLFIVYKTKAFPRFLLWGLAGFTFSGWIATLSGWLVTEIGRQPWLVYGILRTADATGNAVTGAQLGASLTGYLLTYALMFLAYLVVLTHLAGKGSQ
ncbi:MAG TPA: cytochrome ubiquinol oxidase subunit I [Burkholderiales bacterium]|nr:cytochrome ubiquinol oxidase subunit I [Burkholderiales bacterium]